MAPKKPRSKTRSGKKLDKATGKIAVPLVKRGEKGRAVGMTAEDKQAAVTTVLPAAGREVMQPKEPKVVVSPRGTLKRGGLGRQAKGAQVSFPVVQKALNAALHHLNQAHFAYGAGLPADEHLQTFDAIHANIKNMDKSLHTSLMTARHLISTSGGKTTPELTQTQININRRLDELRDVHTENVRRAQAGRENNGS